VNIVYFGDAANEFSNRHFGALEQACSAVASRCRIAAVVDCPNDGWVSTRRGGAERSPAFDARASGAGVPVLRPSDPNSPAAVAELAALEPGLLVAVGYTRRLGAAVLALPRFGAVNFHASLLPAYRGKHPVFWALHFGEPVTGLTVHRMDPRIDAGEILYQVRVRTRIGDSVASLYERIMAKSVGLMPGLLADASAGRLRGRSQEEGLSSYYSSTTPEDFRLRFAMPAELFVRRAAATPGRCWLLLRGRRIWVVEAMPASRSCSGPSRRPGTVQSLGRWHAVVAAQPGAVRLRRLAAEDGEELPAAVLLRRAKLGPGDRIEE
jgi:methionyl-tRNA formyltransferase